MMAKDEPKFVFLVLDMSDVYVGIFKDAKAIERYMERDAVEEVQVFRVTEAFEIGLPPDPDYEWTGKKLSTLNVI